MSEKMTKVEIEQDRLSPGLSRREPFRGGLSSGAAVLALAAVGRATSAFAAGESGGLPTHPTWKFVFVNHVTTNPFFVPTQYGIADACAAFGCSSQWTGSETSVASQMVNAMNTAITEKVDGIAIALVDLHAFNEPTKRALEAGIPVFSYNADAKGNDRLAYIGQDLYASGQALGRRIVDLVGRAPSSASSRRRDSSTSSRVSTAPRTPSRRRARRSTLRRSPPARRSTRKSRGSTPITSDTKTSRACSRSTREARWR